MQPISIGNVPRLRLQNHAPISTCSPLLLLLTFPARDMVKGGMLAFILALAFSDIA